MHKTIPSITLRSGIAVPVLGQGTWKMGEDPSQARREIESLQAGVDLGLTLVDTAEMYGDGGAEEIVGRAFDGRRDGVFLVSKVYPWNASRQGTIDACERSLKRMKTDHIDLYLLHWRGDQPLADTVAAFESLKRAGKIGEWGVSNFDTADMVELVEVADGGNVAVNQVLHNLSRRNAEFDLIPWCQNHDIPVMAYSPIEQGRLLQHPDVIRVAKSHRATPAQVALAFVLRRPGIIAIPKTTELDRLRENRDAVSLDLTDDDWLALDRAFPPPKAKRPLEML